MSTKSCHIFSKNVNKQLTLIYLLSVILWLWGCVKGGVGMYVKSIYLGPTLHQEFGNFHTGEKGKFWILK